MNMAWKREDINGPLLLHFLLIFLSFGVSHVSSIHATGQCVQLGQGNANWKHQLAKDPVTNKPLFGLNLTERWSYWTIGTKKFDVTHLFLDNSANHLNFSSKFETCPYRHHTYPKNHTLYMNPCPGDEVKIKTYAVLQDGVIMRGWLHFEIELTAYPDDEIMGIYVQIRDEHFNAIGEFELHEDRQCPLNTEGLAKPSQYQILPCSAVGFREAKTANALFLVQEDFLRFPTEGAKYLSKDGDKIKKGIAFTWKMSEYWCNRHLRIRPEAIIITKAMVERNVYEPCDSKRGCGCCISPPYRKAAEYWIHPAWFGAADIKKKNTKLNCSVPVINYQTGKFTEDKPGSGKNFASWFLPPFTSPDLTKEDSRPLESRLKNDYIYQYNIYYDYATRPQGNPTIKSCHANPRLGHKDQIPSFSGRCTHHYRKNPSHDALQGCNLDGDAPEFQHLPYEDLHFEPYTEFVHNLTVNRTNLCNVPCRAPTLADLEAIKGYKDRSGEGEFVVQTVFNMRSRNEARVEKLWVGRKYHAIQCTIWTMFLCPVGIFAARYFKETCMDFTCTGIHAWWWVHVGTAVAACWMFMSSIAGIWSNLSTWGRSTHQWGTQHRINGYLSMAAFTLMVILGGIRAGHDPRRRRLRILFMFMHSLCGFSIYFFNVFAIMMSTWIPASPSMDQCDSEGNSASTSRVLIVATVWLVIDICFHLVMTLFQLIVDGMVQIRRPWYCPFIPILPPDAISDLTGGFVRKIMFLMYIGAALIMTTTTVAIIGDNELSETCRNLTGPNDCDGDKMSKIYGCSSYVKNYIKYVMGQTEKNESGTYAVEFVLS